MTSIRSILLNNKQQLCHCSELEMNTYPWEKSWRLKYMPNKNEQCSSRLWDINIYNVNGDGNSYGDRSIGLIEGRLCTAISWLKENGKWHKDGTCGVMFDATYLTPHQSPHVLAKF